MYKEEEEKEAACTNCSASKDLNIFRTHKHTTKKVAVEAVLETAGYYLLLVEKKNSIAEKTLKIQ